MFSSYLRFFYWDESHTLLLRVVNYNSSIELINQSIDSAAKKPWGEDFLKELQAAEKSIYHLLPPESPSRGVLKDFSKSVITFVEGRAPEVWVLRERLLSVLLLMTSL